MFCFYIYIYKTNNVIEQVWIKHIINCEKYYVRYHVIANLMYISKPCELKCKYLSI